MFGNGAAPHVSSTPTDQLIFLIRQRDWEAALQRILQHPTDARFRDTPNRATPLHFALMHRAPHGVIAILVDCFPTALFLQDTEGWTPLHVNILYGSQEETTLLLIKRGGPLAASLHSKFVGSPLHLMCRHGPMSSATLQALVETHPEQVTTSNEVGNFAPNLLYKSFLRRHDLSNRDDVQLLVHQLMIMVDAVYGKDENTATSLQHQAPSLQQIILFQHNHAKETDLVRLVLYLYPHAAITRDVLGRLPIHLAAAQTTIAPTVRPTAPFFPETPRDALILLLEHSPKLAVEPDPTSGRLPLFAAISSAHRTFASGIHALLRAHPSALQEQDPVTNLFAYQLAAVSNPCLSTTYELLRTCPNVLTPQMDDTKLGLVP
jgi:ankyrin repeat protein